MTNIGAEVGQKMRSAIKAKLLELNCYVDDELPDYIMVMVANKRSKSQMKEDLQLFLSTKTATFVDWLHIVLKKLKEVTVTNPEVYKKAVKRSAETAPIDVAVKKEKETKVKTEKIATGSKSLTDDLPINANRLSQQRKIVILNEHRIVNNQTTAHNQDAFDILPLSEVNKATEEELDDIEKKIQSVKSRLGIQVDSDEEDPVKIKQEILRSRDAARAKSSREATNKEKEKTPPKRIKITFEEDESKNPKKSIRDRLGKRSWRNEKSPRSEQVDDVKRKKSEGKEKRRKRSPEKKKSEPRINSGKEGILSRLGVKSKVSVPDRRPESPEIAFHEREVPSVVKIKPRTVPENVKLANKNLLLKAVAEAQKSVNQTPKVGSDKTEALFTKTYKEKQIEKMERKKESAEKVRQTAETSLRIRPRVQADIKEDTLYIPSHFEEPEYIPSAIQHYEEETEEVDRKFVVKLRGCDSTTGKKSIKDRLDKRRSPSPILFDNTIELGATAPKPVSIPDKLPKVHAPLALKNIEKCKFWPGCTKGDRCEFLHPAQQCEKFPKCKFGEKCLFSHPPCKFGTSCTRKDCIYSHKIINLYNADRNVCKFYPNCSNPSCTFFHPTTFGSNNRSSLIWTAK